MNNKITAVFGADISEVESQMQGAIRATARFGEATSAISKKLTTGRIFESILGGVGLGSGFAIAQKAAEAISSYWQKAAEAAKLIADSSQSALDATLAVIRLRRTDQQNLSADKEEEKRLRADAAELQGGRLVKGPGRGFGPKIRIAPTEEEMKEAADKLNKADALRVSIAEREKKTVDELSEKRNKAYENEQEKEEKLADLQRENALAAMATEEKISTLKIRNAALEGQIDVDAKVEVAENEKKILALEEQRTREQEERARKAKSDEDERKRAAKELSDAQTKHYDQLKVKLLAAWDLGVAIRDQSGASFDDVKSGRRGSASDRAKARQADRFIQRAEQVRDGGPEDGMIMDDKGQMVTRGEYADRLVRRANDRRASISSLKSSDRDPLADLTAALDKAQILKSIDGHLAPKDL